MKNTVTVARRSATTALNADQLASLHGQPWIARLLANRGVIDAQELSFSTKALPSPDLFLDIEVAVARIAKAIRQQQSIVVVGDYDCDGATSTSLAVLALRAMGAERVEYCLPNRFKHGYGLSPAVVDLSREWEPDLLITVDNGIASVDGVEHARAARIDVVVTDHHLPDEVLPRAFALINPRIPGANFPSKNIAGVGVIFFVMVALRRHLSNQGWFAASGLEEPNMAAYLDLVALGTVADVVPLDNTNRILVMQGIRRIRAGFCRPGILALLEVAGANYREILTETIGFRIAPRLNAAGRLADMRLGVECLLTDDTEKARELAQALDAKNRERQQVTEAMLNRANEILLSLEQELAQQQQQLMSLCLYDPTWHEGVVGILAGRLKEQFGVPVIIFTRASEPSTTNGTTTAGLVEDKTEVDAEPGMGIEIKGSARSIDGFHVVDALKRIRNDHPHVLQRFGGHAKAAGLTLAEGDFAQFRMVFDQDVRDFFNGRKPSTELQSDGELPLENFDLQTASLLQELAPWGQEFPPPLFDNRFEIQSLKVMKQKHLKLGLQPVAEKTGSQGNTVDAVYFNALPADQADSLELPVAVGDTIHAVFEIKSNSFRNSVTLQLNLKYLQRVD